MRWIRYQANSVPVYGIVEGDEVIEVRGDPFSGYERTPIHCPLSSVKLLVPVEPPTFYCAVLNYTSISSRRRENEVKSRICPRPPISVIAPIMP